MKTLKNILYQASILSVLLVACTDKEEETKTESVLPDPVAIYLDISDANSSIVMRGTGYVPESYSGTGPIELTLQPAAMILPSDHPLYTAFGDKDLNANYHYKLTATRDNGNSKWYFQGYQIDKDTENEVAPVDNKPDASHPDKMLTSPYWANLSTAYKISSLAGLYTNFPAITAGNTTDVSKDKNPFLWQNTPEGYANANLMKFETTSFDFIPKDHLSVPDDKSSPVAIGPFDKHLLSQLHIVGTLNKKHIRDGYNYEMAILGTTNRYSYHSDSGTTTPGVRTKGGNPFPAPYDAVNNPNADPLKDVECIRTLHISTDKATNTVEFAAIIVPGQEAITVPTDASPFLVLTISNESKTDITYLLYSLTKEIAANTFIADNSHKLEINLSGAEIDPNPGVRSLSPDSDIRMIPMKGTINIEKEEWK